VTALYATVCTSGNGVLPDTILHMSPRQIVHIYQHPRDKDGKIIVPEPPADAKALNLDEMLEKLRATAHTLQLPPDQVKQAEEILKAKYGDNR
jgi:hypothetical protein